MFTRNLLNQSTNIQNIALLFGQKKGLVMQRFGIKRSIEKLNYFGVNQLQKCLEKKI